VRLGTLSPRSTWPTYVDVSPAASARSSCVHSFASRSWRTAEANEDVSSQERSTLDHYIETELVNLVTVRDVAELDMRFPGFAEAIHQWVIELREA
jgi:hypothetical protein